MEQWKQRRCTYIKLVSATDGTLTWPRKYKRHKDIVEGIQVSNVLAKTNAWAIIRKTTSSVTIKIENNGIS